MLNNSLGMLHGTRIQESIYATEQKPHPCLKKKQDRRKSNRVQARRKIREARGPFIHVPCIYKMPGLFLIHPSLMPALKELTEKVEDKSMGAPEAALFGKSLLRSVQDATNEFNTGSEIEYKPTFNRYFGMDLINRPSCRTRGRNV